MSIEMRVKVEELIQRVAQLEVVVRQHLESLQAPRTLTLPKGNKAQSAHSGSKTP
jgi:hypothetical protein